MSGLRQMPLFEPPSDWQPSDALPDIPSDVVLAVDLEGRDGGLAADRGPGWPMRDGHIAGYSVAWADQGHYIPVQHPDSHCFDRERVRNWLASAMQRARRVVFHHQAYDEGWMSTESIPVPEGRTDDTYVMAVMLDENQDSYSLDNCCRREGVPGKDERLLREAAAAFGVDPKGGMWRLPARHVAPYAIRDAVATLGLWERLQPRIERERLEEAYRLEMDLIPMVLEMRRRGIRVNEDTADRVRAALREERDAELQELRDRLSWRRLGMEELLSPTSLERMCDQEGVTYPRTPKTGRGSFKSDWMRRADHWLPRGISRLRQLDDLAEKFIGHYILGSVHLGRVHAEVHQLRDDEGGTRSYRFSYSDPPLQQIPAKSAEAPLIRSVFEAEDLWLSADYSQQEPRLAVHFAALCGLAGAETAEAYYRDNPDADFHAMVAELTGVPRPKAKIINLGLMYGMGLEKLAASLGISKEEAAAMLAQYHERMPFVQKLTDFCRQRADQRGFIRLLDGARSRFDLWEPAFNRGDGYKPPRPHTQALAASPGTRLRRAFTHKAMNRLIQGSAARQTKLAMRECWRAGIVPLLQMHDELDFSVSTEAESERIAELMRDVVPLRVPMKVDLQHGWNWGQASQEPPKGVAAPSIEEIRRASPRDSVAEILERRAA